MNENSTDQPQKTPQITSQKPPTFFSVSRFFSTIHQKPAISMLWGETGVGKTTLALQLAKYILETSNKKVFYLYTKLSPNMQQLQRLLSVPPSGDYSLPFFYFHNTTIASQQKCIYKWLLQIQSANQFTPNHQVGLIIVDEIFSSYLIELRKNQPNEKLMAKMIDILSTLKKISVDYHMPILLLNTFSVKEDGSSQRTVAKPHGGKLLDFWIDTEIKLTRTAQLRLIQFEVQKNDENSTIPSAWRWALGAGGFQSKY